MTNLISHLTENERCSIRLEVAFFIKRSDTFDFDRLKHKRMGTNSAERCTKVIFNLFYALATWHSLHSVWLTMLLCALMIVISSPLESSRTIGPDMSSCAHNKPQSVRFLSPRQMEWLFYNRWGSCNVKWQWNRHQKTQEHELMMSGGCIIHFCKYGHQKYLTRKI